MARELLGEQMTLGNVEFLGTGIGGKADDLHAVDEGKRDPVVIVRGGDKNAIRKIERQLEKMIAEIFVLLGIENLKQRRCRIAVHAGGELIDLVEHQNGVVNACRGDRLNDTAGHSAHVGLSVTANVSLVTDAAE